MMRETAFEGLIRNYRAKKLRKNITKEGKGFPSLWLPSSPEDLEEISLGIILRKGHLDTLNLLGCMT